MRRPDAHCALIRALIARYPGLLVLASRSEPWASVTFTGARHELTCAAGPDLTGIEDEEFTLPAHVIADVRVLPTQGGITIEVLTIEAA